MTRDELARALRDEFSDAGGKLDGWLAVADRAMAENAAEVTRLRQALGEALDLAEEGWSYAGDYFRDKWESNERIAELRTLASEET